jgi:alpha,alpha-trehalase
MPQRVDHPVDDCWVQTPEPALNRAFSYVRDHWAELTRPGEWLAFPLPNPYVRPGGFFKMFCYWDSYFIVLGLVTQGRWELATGIVENMIFAVEQIGHVPCYLSSKAACRSRSQPPFMTSAIREVAPFVDDRAWLSRAVAAAEREYLDYWTAEPHLTETGLSRFVDPGHDGCVTVPDTPHHRAMAESGWDNTARFGDDSTTVVPVDLNAQLYRYEQDLAGVCAVLGRNDDAVAWRERATARRDLINQLLWIADEGIYRDLDLRTGQPLRSTPRALSAFVPLWAGLADADQAARLVEQLPLFEHRHGLTATEPGWDGDQHDFPTGWAYSHWYATEGLYRAGYRDAAVRIALKWLRLVAAKLDQTGAVFERYNVVDADGPTPGRYPPQRGFGWTNGVFAALLVRTVLGICPTHPAATPARPTGWNVSRIAVHLPRYPWPTGTQQLTAAIVHGE